MNVPSEHFKRIFSVKCDPKTNEGFVFIENDVRFSVLSSQLLRVESGAFCDEPTQSVLFRNFSKPAFSRKAEGNIVIVATKKAIFKYDTKAKKMLSVVLRDGRITTDMEKGNLKGTARTLDGKSGAIPLGDGLVSRNGVSMLNDSKSCIINNDGTFSERKKCSDIYYFAFGNDFRECIFQLTELCGKIPLIPRYCLGNWWSRYKAYTQQEYLDLMKKFKDREIPISVATIDMDWHWVDVEKRFGKEAADGSRKPFQIAGWTGYSWNTELFPDYRELLKELRKQGFKITVNIHPAQGIRFFEDQYNEFAEYMGIDPRSKKTVKFDIADPKFVEGYFDILHRPYEQDGVDFWWIDWQQERTTKIKGLDPLWALNHYHTLAFSEQNKRPLILSRFAEVGSHRYPLGFSGDAIISWKSLDFQPFFTVNAANVGYGWWSHDIGGHMLGKRDDELYARWVQFGQYSPIMRLHSTNDEFMGKEPWNYSFPAEEAATNALRERHAMIPYIYSMNKRSHDESIALCEPVYYSYPDEPGAYSVKNEYFFGSELLVSPITQPASEKTNLAKADVWLPKGRWTDIYTGYIYEGGKTVSMFRDLRSIPVLAKEGAILPVSSDDRTNDTSNPKELIVRVWRGNGNFELYEDDGETMDFEHGCFAKTMFEIKEIGSTLHFSIGKAKGDLSLIPSGRKIELIFEDITDCSDVALKINGEGSAPKVKNKNGSIHIMIDDYSPEDEYTLVFSNCVARQNIDKKELIIERLSKIQGDTISKRIRFGKYINDIKQPFSCGDRDIEGAVNEIFDLV